ERDIAGPLVGIVAAVDGKIAVAVRTHRDLTGRLISDISIHVGIHHVLSRCVEVRKRLPKLLPILCRINMKEGVADAIVKRPAKRDFPRLSRGKLRHDWTVTRDLHIESHIRFPLDVNYFVPNLRGFPALRREVLSLSIKCFDIRVFNCRTYVRTSPRNPPVVTDNY